MEAGLLVPQRFLRPGITNSSLWNAVEPQAANLFIRLLTLVDDYGRTDGRASVILGHCFSVWNEMNPKRPVKLPHVLGMLGELYQVGLIDVYEIDSKTVVQILQWQERIREGTKSKWPERTEVAASCSKLLLPSPSPSPSPASRRHSTNDSQANASVPSDDEAWITELSRSVAYEGIDVRKQHAKMVIWCREHRKHPTRRRFIRWLNNQESDKPMRAVPKAKPLDPSKIELPERFKSWAGEKYHARKDEIMAWKTWAEVPGSLRTEWWTEEKAKLPISI